MMIVGAKGFAKEVLEIFYQNNNLKDLVFYDDVNLDIGTHLFNEFIILKNIEEAKKYFQTTDSRFTIGIGNPELREKLYKKFKEIGGVFTSTISSKCSIGNFGVNINAGCNIMTNVVITNDINIGTGVIINQLSSIGHDVVIGAFSEICPNVSISGNCEIGEKTFIGTGSIILPKIIIGNNVIVGAGSVVTKNIPDNAKVVGIPAKIIG